MVSTKFGGAAAAPPPEPTAIQLGVDDVVLAGNLFLPATATATASAAAAAAGLVLFAHGSGSSRHSPRNRHVAAVLNDAGLATLLFDLLTASEERHRANVFDIDLLARRLRAVGAWTRARPELAGLPIGYFGASTGAGAALWAAGEPAADVAAVVCRGGRPDLAGPRLARVRAPTLLIVGGHDPVVERLNRDSAAQLRCERRVVVVPGASHLFEEPGTLQRAAELARDWFVTHFPSTSQAPAGSFRAASS
jgi:putative phosphoribosyl transferase